VYVGRVCPAADCKTNFLICIEVTVATTHPTRNLVEFQHTPAGHTRPTYTVYFLLKARNRQVYVVTEFFIDGE
jgi:hypothetical protein